MVVVIIRSVWYISSQLIQQRGINEVTIRKVKLASPGGGWISGVTNCCWVRLLFFLKAALKPSCYCPFSGLLIDLQRVKSIASKTRSND